MVRSPPLALALAAALTACVAPGASRPRGTAGEAGVFQGTASASPAGALETGRLSREKPVIPGPFVLTYLGPGDEVEIVPVDGKAVAIGTVAGPLMTPLQIPAGAKLVLRSQEAGALYSGYRPMVMTRPLEAYLGRNVQVAVGTAPAEPWLLRQVGTDHLILERSRTYRVLPLRRIAELSWTDLSGIDPTPKLILTAE